MATMDIAIEIGTTFTSIYVSGEGVVLREPSVVAYYGDDKKLLAVGRDAWEKKGKTPDGTTVVCPVADGYVSDFDVTKDMVAQFIKRILPPSYVIFPKIRAILVVPTGLSVDERRIYEDAVLGAGVSECTLVENATAVALGTDLDLEKGGLVATIGGGVSEVALISSFGVIAGCSISVGGNMMDKALSDYLMGKYGVRIGSSTARKLKEEIGSLYPGDVASMDATGIGVDSFGARLRYRIRRGRVRGGRALLRARFRGGKFGYEPVSARTRARSRGRRLAPCGRRRENRGSRTRYRRGNRYSRQSRIRLRTRFDDRRGQTSRKFPPS